MSNLRPRAREIGITIGALETGRQNSITDVADVKVGHFSLISGEGKLTPGMGPVRTGVTMILPHGRNLFQEKVIAAAYVINGFGKSIGLPQIIELGNLETPIALTNTLNVGIVADALIDVMLEKNEDIGVTTGTVNPVVGECNDGFLNDIRGRHVKKEHVFEALKKATQQGEGRPEEGSVGAGVGMTAFNFKGGIGTASRKLPAEIEKYTLGALVLSNFGSKQDLVIDSVPVGQELVTSEKKHKPDGGSIIVIIATDAPLNSGNFYVLHDGLVLAWLARDLTVLTGAAILLSLSPPLIPNLIIPTKQLDQAYFLRKAVHS